MSAYGNIRTHSTPAGDICDHSGENFHHSHKTDSSTMAWRNDEPEHEPKAPQGSVRGLLRPVQEGPHPPTTTYTGEPGSQSVRSVPAGLPSLGRKRR